jgi:SOS-response transcriptional repressor LexA
MLPAYIPGDHVLTFNWVRIKVGDVIVFKIQDRHSVSFLKRVDKIIGEEIYLSGDNKKESSQVKPIKKSQIIGKVILKY